MEQDGYVVRFAFVQYCYQVDNRNVRGTLVKKSETGQIQYSLVAVPSHPVIHTAKLSLGYPLQFHISFNRLSTSFISVSLRLNFLPYLLFFLGFNMHFLTFPS